MHMHRNCNVYPAKPLNVHINSNLQKTRNWARQWHFMHRTHSRLICAWERELELNRLSHGFYAKWYEMERLVYFNWSWSLSSTHCNRQPFSIVTIKLNFYRVIRLTILSPNSKLTVCVCELSWCDKNYIAQRRCTSKNGGSDWMKIHTIEKPH